MKGAFQFGPFDVDPVLGQLRREGEPVRLQDQPFHLLLLLTDRPGELVTRDEIREALWPGDTFVEFEHSLNTAVNRLRTALGDSASDPLYIETLPRRGYRFIGTVERLNQESPEIGKARHARRIWRYALAVFGLAGVAFAVWILAAWLRQRPAQNPPPRELTALDGFVYCPTFSPDGSQIAFTWDSGDGNRGLFLLTLGTPTPRELVRHTMPVSNPSWSPDGTRIAYTLPLAGGKAFEVRTIAPTGIGDQSIGQFDGTMMGLSAEVGANQLPLAWSRDSRYLIIGRMDPYGGLQVLEVRTGRTRQITEVGKDYSSDTHVSVSHGGDRVAFIRHENPWSTGYLYVLKVDPEMNPLGEPQRIEIHPESNPEISIPLVFDPVWTAGDKEIVLRVEPAALGRVNSDGRGQTRWLGIGSGLQPALSRDGRKLVYVSRKIDSDIWEYDVRTKQHRLRIASSGIDRHPSFSPDGSHIAWQAFRGRGLNIWVSKADGSDAHPVVPDASVATGTWAAAWSPDGKMLAVERRIGGNPDIYLVSPDGGPMKALVESPADDLNPGWSYDGSAVYFCSNRDGTYRLWRIAVGGGDPVPVNKLGDWPQSSADGRFLFFRKDRNEVPWKLLQRSLRDGQEHTAIVGFSQFEVHEKGIYFTRRSQPKRILWFDLATGTESVAFEFDEPFGSFSVSRSGQTVLYDKLERGGSDLWLVEPFW